MAIVALVGYGRMGKIIHSILQTRGHQVGLIVDPQAPEAHKAHLDCQDLQGIDGVIEFSLPGDLSKGLVENVSAYAKAKIKVVLGTTGWEAEKSKVLGPVFQTLGYDSSSPTDSDGLADKVALLYGSNFSVGAQLLFRVSAYTTLLAEKIGGYDLMIHEFHHNQKKDSPSGTALSLADQVLKNSQTKTTILADAARDRAIRPDELHVSSTRGGKIPGIHTLTLDSDADTLEITHTARNREGFALGAVMGLEWLLKNNKVGVYTTDDFFDTLFDS